jgi:hypothetical protein
MVTCRVNAQGVGPCLNKGLACQNTRPLWYLGTAPLQMAFFTQHKDRLGFLNQWMDGWMDGVEGVDVGGGNML